MPGANLTIVSRGYQGEDDLSVMQRALASWIYEGGTCGYCHTGDLPHRIYNGLRGRYPLDEVIRLWFVDGRLEGFVLVYPRHHGFDAQVSPTARGGDFEKMLLSWGYTHSRAWMDREDEREQAVETDAHDGDTSRANSLIALGFTPDASSWMMLNERPLVNDLPEAVLPDGYRIRSATGVEDAARLAAVHSGAFGSQWTADIYRDEVMQKPGYDPSLEHVIVAPDGTFAAFCITWLDTANRIGLFEPVGTHRDYQRKGLGRAMMAYGLRFMRENGMRTAQVCSETDNTAASRLYQSMGFKPEYPITAYEKP